MQSRRDADHVRHLLETVERPIVLTGDDPGAARLTVVPRCRSGRNAEQRRHADDEDDEDDVRTNETTRHIPSPSFFGWGIPTRRRPTRRRARTYLEQNVA